MKVSIYPFQSAIALTTSMTPTASDYVYITDDGNHSFLNLILETSLLHAFVLVIHKTPCTMYYLRKRAC